MILTDKAIEAAVRGGNLEISPFTKINLKKASYTFTLSPRILIPQPKGVLDIDEEMECNEVLMGDAGYILAPGTFLLGFTVEKLSLKNNFSCFLSSRGSCAQLGLNVLFSSVYAEPDTDNPLTLEIHNSAASPIRIKPRMKIIKGVFTSLRS